MSLRKHSVDWIKWGFWAMYTVVFIGIAYKALTVPITHDEGWTVIKYLDKSVWDIMMYPDNWPNNHIFNTLLAKTSAGLFGTSSWSVRLPNLVFFWVYAWGVYRFLKQTFKENKILFLPAATLFVLSPYFLDFFGLCRGYGISSALTMFSLSYFVSGFMTVRRSHIWIALILALIASYANFTVLLYFAAACLIAAFYFLIHRKNWMEVVKFWGMQLALFAAYAWLIYTPILKMKSTNQFEFWTSKGFYEETVFTVIHSSLTDSALYTRQEWFAILVVVLTIALWIWGGWKLLQSRNLAKGFQAPMVITGSVLLLTVLINLLQTSVLGDPNLNGRTALFLLPIFLSLVASGLAQFPSLKYRKLALILGSVLVLITVQHLSVSYRPNSFKEWRYDQYTDEVIAFMDNQSDEKEKPKLRVAWEYQNSFEFHHRYEHLSWNLQLGNNQMEVDPNTDVDFYYVPEAQVTALQSNFSVVKTFDGGQTLMHRKR